MEVDLKPDITGRKMIMKSSPVKPTDHSSRQLKSPLRQVKLPPLGADDDSTGTMFLDQTKDQVEEAMKHLQSEAHTVETKIQESMDALWKRMLDIMEYRKNEMQQEMAGLKSELSEAHGKLAQLASNEANHVQQSAMARMQLAKEENKKKELEMTLEKMKERVDKSDKELNNIKQSLKEKEKSQHNEVDKLKAQLEEKTKILKEYQTKISKMTDKMNALSKDLNQEKNQTEKSHKQITDQLNQQIAENKKLILEISKLKSHVSNSNAALSTAKEENKRLESKLKLQQQDHEATLARLNKSHSATVKDLENQIILLKKEIENLKIHYLTETELLHKKLQETEQALVELTSNNDDYLETRIQFLRHQNKQEKVKLQKDLVASKTNKQ